MNNKSYYENLVNNAFLNVVKSVLNDVATGNIKFTPCLYLTFKTAHGKVKIPSYLQERFPDDMTIVIQHQYEDLCIYDDRVSIVLSFSGRKEELVIPFDALTSFYDTENEFSLVFNPEIKKTEKKEKPKIISLTDLKKKK